MLLRKPPRFLQNPLQVWLLNEVATAYGQRPSDLLVGGWMSYVFDRAVHQASTRINNELERTDKKGKRVNKTVGDAIKALKPKVFENTEQAMMALMSAFGSAVDIDMG